MRVDYDKDQLAYALANALKERDDAREERDIARLEFEEISKERYEEIQKVLKERDEAREKAERYRLEANAMMLQRDEAREVLREIAEASGFDNIGNWARNKARNAIYR